MSTFVIYPTEEQAKVVADISFEKDVEVEEDLPEHVLKDIQESLAEFEAGNYISHEEFKKRIDIE